MTKKLVWVRGTVVAGGGESRGRSIVVIADAAGAVEVARAVEVEVVLAWTGEIVDGSVNSSEGSVVVVAAAADWERFQSCRMRVIAFAVGASARRRHIFCSTSFIQAFCNVRKKYKLPNVVSTQRTVHCQ